MHALILAATLVATPQNPGQATRDIVIGVCLPFVASGEASADNIALADLQLQPGDEQAFQTGDGRHLVELSTRGDAEEGTLRRTCTVQARAGGFEQARDAVAGPLQRAGFTPSPDEPEDWPPSIRTPAAPPSCASAIRCSTRSRSRRLPAGRRRRRPRRR